MLEAEGARRSEFGRVAFGRNFHLDRLLSYRFGKIDFARQPERIVWNDRDAFPAVLYGNRTANPQVSALTPQPAYARAPQQIHKGLAAAIQDGDLQVVDLHPCIVDGETIERAEQVFGSLNQNALAHQTGRITHSRHVLPAGRDREIIEIRASENDSSSRGCRRQPHFDRDTGMQAYAGDFERPADGSFKSQDQS